MKPEQREIKRLRREVTKLKAERDILKKPRPTSRRLKRDVWFHCEALRDLAGKLDVRRARCVAKRLLRLVEACIDDNRPRRRSAEDGVVSTRQAGCADASLRSRTAVHERAISATDGGARRRLLDAAGPAIAGTESFFSSLKTERTARKTYRSRD